MIPYRLYFVSSDVSTLCYVPQEDLLERVSKARKYNAFNTESSARHCNPPFGLDLAHEVRYVIFFLCFFSSGHSIFPVQLTWSASLSAPVLSKPWSQLSIPLVLALNFSRRSLPSCQQYEGIQYIYIYM